MIFANKPSEGDIALTLIIRLPLVRGADSPKQYSRSPSSVVPTGNSSISLTNKDCTMIILDNSRAMSFSLSVVRHTSLFCGFWVEFLRKCLEAGLSVTPNPKFYIDGGTITEISPSPLLRRDTNSKQRKRDNLGAKIRASQQ